jgi:hypothetical protein
MVNEVEGAGGSIARNPVRDERQGDLFGPPPPLANPARRASPPKPAPEETSAPEPVLLGELGQRVTKPEIDEFLHCLPDQELAYLVVEATRLIKQRLTQKAGEGLRPKGASRGKSPLDDTFHRIASGLMEFEGPGKTW